MTDLACSFLYSRSLTTNSDLPLFLPPKRYPFSAFHSHNSRIVRFKRSAPRLILLFKPSPFAASASDIDVISTHEHSDGSFLFRFGDPSEIQKNVEMEEPKTVDEEIDGEDEKGSSAVKLKEGDDEAEVLASGITEACDLADSIVSNSNIAIPVEGESEYSELPVLTSSKDINEEYGDSSAEGTSITDESSRIENSSAPLEVTSDESLNEDQEASTVDVDASVIDKSSEVVNGTTTEALLEKETNGMTFTCGIEKEPIRDVEEGMDEEYEDSPVDTSVLDNRSEVLNIITTETSFEGEIADTISTSETEIDSTVNLEESTNEEYGESLEYRSVPDNRSDILNIVTTEAAASEKGSDGITTTSDIEIEPTGSMEEGIDKESEDSPGETSVLDNRSEDLSIITTEESSEKESADMASAPDVEIEHPVKVEQGLDQDFLGKEAAGATPISEYQKKKTIGDNLVSSSPQSEPAVCNEETEEPILQSELRTLATKESSETDANNIKVIEMQNVLSNDNGAEAESPTIEPAMTWSAGLDGQASGSGSEILNETVGYASEKDMIQLLTVPPQLEADSMLEEKTETETETVEEPRDDDGSENQTAGRDLEEASVHEVITPESAKSTTTSQEMLTTDLDLSAGAALLPHPSKVLTGGEDAYFIAGQTWLGLADGVSQWSLQGTIKGVYADELMRNCEKLVSDCSNNSINNPIQLLNLSVAQTDSPGSSTVLIAHFDGQALHVANVGDSGFIVLRHGAVYKKCSPMHHAFSLPVLVERGDDPSCLAQLYRVDLEEEDLIVLATDGLLDNLYDQEISLIAMKSLADHKSPEEIAALLVKRAREVGSSASARSPFADDAQAAGFPGYSGGKLDDVAVIVSVVQRRRR